MFVWFFGEKVLNVTLYILQISTLVLDIILSQSKSTSVFCSLYHQYVELSKRTIEMKKVLKLYQVVL